MSSDDMAGILLIIAAVLSIVAYFKGYTNGEKSKRSELLRFPDSKLPCVSAYKPFLELSECTLHHIRNGELVYGGKPCNKRECQFAHIGSHNSLMRMITVVAMAKRQIYLCMFQFTLNVMADVLIHMHSKGCRVIIITDRAREKNRNDQIPRLIKKGILVKERGIVSKDEQRPLMHNKYAIIDDEIVIHGSLNWTYAAVLHNSETVTLSYDRDLVYAFTKDFRHIFHSIE